MKVKIIKNLSGAKEWDKYIGKIYTAERTEDGGYLVKIDPYLYMTVWSKKEVKEVK